MSPALRSHWADVAKGIGIVLVVYAHVARGLVSAGIATAQSPLQIVDFAIYSFHMPLFFVLAGLFARQSLAKGASRFWRRKLQYLVYPYLLWSVVQGGLQIALSSFGNHHPLASELTSILWLPFQQFWFLYALFWCHVVFAILHRRSNGLLLAIAAAMLVSRWCIDLGTASTVASAFFYYALGVVVAGVADRSPQSLTAILGLAVIFLVIVATIYDSAGSRIGVLAASLIGIALTISVSRRFHRRLGVVRLLGSLSMSIFVMHVVAAAALRALLLRVFHSEDVVLHLAFGTAGGIFLPVAAYLVLARLGWLPWLGLPQHELAPFVSRSVTATAAPPAARVRATSPDTSG
jgi:fucose 4-O-acetylase-like acetyltransferase